ncbi:class gamma glutathione S-transferase [Chlamydoabsidia padenii]|nr:class gamma glutathione S-transferase [Chlamydoabsidia padenii]
MTNTSATLHYFAIPNKPSTSALGENIHLLLKDSGIDFTYHQHTSAEWADIKQDLIKNKNIVSPTMPFVDIDGNIFTKTVPTIRYLTKKLGQYGGATVEEDYTLDAVADVVRDHYTTTLPVFRAEDPKVLEEHFQKNTTKYLGIYNELYGQKDGAYFLGEKISYVDFLVYHIIDDDNALAHVKDYPNLVKFVDAFSQRPALAEYLVSVKK